MVPFDGHVLVTGASSGIGQAMAERLARTATRLVLVARRADRLEQLADRLRAIHPELQVDVESCDLSSTEATLDLAGRVGRVDVLINNAGLGDLALLERTTEPVLSTMLGVNITGLTLLTHALLPGMVARGAGGILNVSSVYGLVWSPGVAAYAGSKHYVTAFTESLRSELRGTGVVVTLVCPGPVKTEFEDKAGFWFAGKPPAFIHQTAQSCASDALIGFSRGRALVVPGLPAKLTWWSSSFTPRWLLRLIYRPFAWLLRRSRVR